MDGLTNRRGWIISTLIAVAVFAGVAPTLTWLEFSGGSENLTVGTVLEMHRGGSWLTPTLHGKVRVKKPPLSPWIAASFVSPQTVTDLSNPDPANRDAAYRMLAWQIRWPALVMSCVMILASYELGRTFSTPRMGVYAAGICASTLLYIRFGRIASTDTPLALFCTLANLFLAKAIFKKWKPGWIWAGLMIGLALMSKGPVAWLMTIAPVAVYLIVQRRLKKPTVDETHWKSIGLGVLVMLAIALPWPTVMLRTQPHILEQWKKEITRDGATDLNPDPWYAYISVIPDLLPWTGISAIAIVVAIVAALRRRRLTPRMMLAIFWVAIPIVVMSAVSDKNDRYLFPLASAAALVGAYGLRIALNKPAVPFVRWMIAAHWVVLAGLTIGGPILGAMPKLASHIDGSAWFSPQLAATYSVAGTLAFAIALVAFKKNPRTIVASTFILMLAINALFVYGYADSKSGRSEMRPIANRILQAAPDAQVYYYDFRSAKKKPLLPDLHIYLNRVVTEIEDPATIPQSAKPQVMVILQREKEAPHPIPGWTIIATEPSGTRFWHALLRTSR